MPFRFSLQEVLDYRRRLEEMRQTELQETVRRVEYVENLVRQARQRRAECHEEMQGKMSEGSSFGRQRLYLDYMAGLDLLIRRTLGHLDELRRELERRRERLTAAMRDREVLDELGREERRLYLVEESRAETKDYDEFAIRNYLQAERAKIAAQGEETRP